MFASPSIQSLSVSARRVVSVAAVLALMLELTACTSKADAATQVVAKVNKEELSIHQVNYLLQRQPGLRPEQTDAASRQILERLIDQELAIQKAGELKVDRDPEVIQAIAAARREIISRAYLDHVSNTASRPTPDEVKRYFDRMPALFRERRVYELQEVSIQAKRDQLDTLRTDLRSAKSAADLTKYLRADEIRFSVNASIRPAEQVPLSMLDMLAKMNDGEAVLAPAPHGADVVFVVSSQSSPLDEAKARPAIEQFLLNERKRQLVEKDIKWLRETGKVEYLGKFAPSMASASTGAPPAAPAIRSPGAGAEVAK